MNTGYMWVGVGVGVGSHVLGCFFLKEGIHGGAEHLPGTGRPSFLENRIVSEWFSGGDQGEMGPGRAG
jgi:hypothetical protein